jgi:holo-[acyl-carrier protein] synthase
VIVGIGVDVVDLAELATSVVDRPRMSARVFTRSELAYCRALAKPLESLGARFAAKEAAFKAVGCGWAKGVTWHDAQVVATSGERPTLRVRGALARHARALGATDLHLSLSHSGGYAVAVVVAWRGDD